MVRGYHVYKDTWSAEEGEVLRCVRETNNHYDPYAVAVVKDTVGTVGHVPKAISALCSLFLRRGGSISCRVDGDRRYSRDLLWCPPYESTVTVPCFYLVHV